MANTDARFKGEIFRKDHPAILAARRELAVLLPVKLLYSATGYKAGTVLGTVTASGAMKAYSGASADGSEVAVCVLMDDVPASDFADTDAATYQVVRGCFAGLLHEGALIGLDAGAMEDLKATSILSATGSVILKF